MIDPWLAISWPSSPTPHAQGRTCSAARVLTKIQQEFLALWLPNLPWWPSWKAKILCSCIPNKLHIWSGGKKINPVPVMAKIRSFTWSKNSRVWTLLFLSRSHIVVSALVKLLRPLPLLLLCEMEEGLNVLWKLGHKSLSLGQPSVSPPAEARTETQL